MAGEINRVGQFAEIVPALARFYLGRTFGLGICAQLLLHECLGRHHASSGCWHAVSPDLRVD